MNITFVHIISHLTDKIYLLSLFQLSKCVKICYTIQNIYVLCIVCVLIVMVVSIDIGMHNTTFSLFTIHICKVERQLLPPFPFPSLLYCFLLFVCLEAFCLCLSILAHIYCFIFVLFLKFMSFTFTTFDDKLIRLTLHSYLSMH